VHLDAVPLGGERHAVAKELGDNASRDERIAALHAATGEKIGRTGDDTSGAGHSGFLLSQRKAGFREVMTRSG
jgi:hypothetical protein